jgi:hypothetical protein
VVHEPPTNRLGSSNATAEKGMKLVAVELPGRFCALHRGGRSEQEKSGEEGIYVARAVQPPPRR